MTLQLEAATTRIGERAAIAAEFPLFLENRRRGLQIVWPRQQHTTPPAEMAFAK